MASAKGSSRPPLIPWSKSTWARWAAMPRMSTGAIPRTKFLLMKAPVSTLYEERFGGDRFMFTVAMYGGRMMAKGVQVGCTVDCTALDLAAFETPPDGKVVRYFHDTNEWDDFDVDYHFLAPASPTIEPGKGEVTDTIPPPSAVQRFLSICANHWKARPNEHIALFDSRGGMGVASYLAALYMCEKMRAPVHAALASVREVMKPCGLADAELARDLQRRYEGRREVRIENIPGWWWAVDDDADDDEEEEEGGDDGEDAEEKKKKRDRDLTVVIPPFEQLGGNGAKADGEDDGGGPARKRPRPGGGPSEASEAPSRGFARPDVPGLQAQPQDSPRYERAVAVLRQLTGKPCTSGIPVGEEALASNSNLTHGRYKVTWRSRGRRGMLLILSEGVYFLENGADGEGIDVSIVKGGMHFPQPKNYSQPQHRTLLDGVLVTDREGPHTVPRYYATDILCHMGGMLTSKPFGHRIKFLMDGVILARKKDTRHDYRREPIKIRAKEYFELGKLEFVLTDVARGVAHDTDGVVMVPIEGKYYNADGPSAEPFLLWKKGGELSQEELVKHASGLN